MKDDYVYKNQKCDENTKNIKEENCILYYDLLIIISFPITVLLHPS